MQKPRISIIAAIGQNRELGKGNDLIWRISSDLKRVKDLTMGHPIIMGRKTYESIGRPLPGRTNIVVTGSRGSIEGCLVYDSFLKALDAARALETDEVFIFGGARIYAESLPQIDRLYLTRIEREDQDADAFFPDYSEFSREVFREEHVDCDPPFTWLVLEKAA